ncbi:MAG TPA: hypothetical protein VFO10_17720 [Oligoflexus sp.]|uniref:hypothetical protein n=1 Tax=Oligoflexus sp. TaxID=1971216 RepID=UPI002D7F09EA|nr:hypothetical protein [Oligoflexus sp.]HET9239102.1 hypothetical protein [Oligoflexus sp.]
MNSFFARTTLLGLSLIASAAAAKPFQSLDTIKAEFTALGSPRYVSATATINYAKDTLDLVLVPVCNPAEGCDVNEPATAAYSFESVNSTVDRCGVVKTVALMDYIPVDGTRTQVTLTDASNFSCRGRKPAVATLNFEQKWYDRINGKWIQIRDRFASDYVETAVAFQGVIRAELESVTSQAFKGGSLFFDGRKTYVELTLNPVDGSESQIFTFDNAYTTVNDCGIIQTVASFDNKPVDGPAMKVTINNNRNNTCPTFAPLNTLDVVVENEYYSRLERGLVKTVDLLKADDIALIKPGK